MAAYGAAQRDWYGYANVPAQVEPSRSPQIGPSRVLRGAGRDAQAKKGVSASIVTAFKTVLVIATLVFGLGLIRVGVCASTVGKLQENNALKQEVSSAQDTNRALQIEINALSNNTRIANLATQKYNMVYAGAGETIHVELPQK